MYNYLERVCINIPNVYFNMYCYIININGFDGVGFIEYAYLDVNGKLISSCTVPDNVIKNRDPSKWVDEYYEAVEVAIISQTLKNIR